MDMRCSLADVARREFKALVQDAKFAIDGLERQRESVIQAIEAAQMADGLRRQLPDETDLLITGLLDEVHRLSELLSTVMYEIEQIEMNQFSPGSGQVITWPIWLNLVPSEPQESR